ncbi:tape measure protein [Acinetobacter haemolyticus]|uniref:tape measure protein n=1 Tax=Acinetobacter haemolyticus TaxID=29430 RepID=UPI0013731910|nr:tape measure protein [Acinetobacter haemolyticus]NAS06212.1 tape measure protein [Acinetobacter haemolyticus]
MTQVASLVIRIDSREAERRSQDLQRELESIGRTGDFATKSMDSMSVATRKLAGFMAGIITVNQAISRADGYTQLAARIRNATDSAAEYDLVQKRLFESTKSTYRALSEAQEVYLGLTGGMKALNYTVKDTLDVSDSLSFAFVANAARADQAQSAIDAFSKSMAKGKIDADAWISIVSAADNVIADMAKTTGRSEVEIRKLGATGKIALDDLIKTLKLTKDANKDLADAMENSLADGLTTLSNAVTQFLGELNMSTGATSTAAAGLGVLADNIESVTNVAMIGGAYWLATYIPTLVKSGIAVGDKVKALGTQVTVQYAAIQAERAAAAQELLNAQAKTLTTQTTLAAVQAEKALEVERLKAQINQAGRIATTTRMAQLRRVESQVTAELTAAESALAAAKTRSAAASTASMGAGRALLGVLGGPMGLGLTVAGVAASYLLLSSNSRTSTNALEAQKKTVSELVEEYKKLNLEKLISQQDEIKKQIKDSQNEISTAFMSLERMTKLRKNSTQDEIDRSLQLKKVIADLNKQSKDGVVQTGDAFNRLKEIGFSEKDISKINKYFTQLNNGVTGLKEYSRQQGLLSQQTGIYGDKLDENQKKIAAKQASINALSGDYQRMTNEIKRDADALIEQAFAFGLTQDQLVELKNARDDYDKGTISSTQLSKVLNENLPISQESLSSFGKLANKTDEVKDKLDNANTSLGKTNEENAKLVQKTEGVQSFYQAHIQGAKNASEELSGLNKSLQELHTERLFDASFIDDLMKRGFSESHARDLLKSYKEAIKLGLDNIDTETAKILKRSWAIENSIKSQTDARTDSIRNQNKELEKQVQLGQRLVGISGNSGIGTGAHLDVRYGGSRDGQKVSREHLERLQAGGKPLTQHRVTSDFGPRKAPTKGASSFHKGIDFAMPVGTPITTNVAVKDVQTAYDPKGGGYYSTVTFEDGVVLKLLHQAPDMRTKVKGGATTGFADGSGSKTYEQQLDLQKSLELEVANEILRIRENLKDRLADVDVAGFSPERAAVVKAQLQERADNDIAIAQQALKTKLDDYKAFTKTEEQLLRDSFAKRQFDALHDLELTKEQRKEAVNLLDQQLQQELGLLKLAQEQRLFQSKQFLYSEIEAIRERYRIEREEIEKTVKDEVEKRKRLSLSKDQERLDLIDRAAQANRSWGGTYAGMTGNSQQFQFEQERIDQTSQSYQLAEALEALANTAEEKEAIWQAHNDRMLMIDQNYWANTTALQLNTASSVFGSLTSLAEGYAGKQSGIYKTLWAAERSFSLASVFASNSVALAKAWGSAPFPANLPAVGITAAKTGVLQAALQAFNPKGFADGGYTGNGLKHTPAGIVHKGEVVWSQEDIKRWGGVNVVESMRNGTPKGYADGGYVNNSTAVGRETRQFDAINQSKASIQAPVVNIINQTTKDVSATSEWDGKELTVILKEHQKQNEAMVDAKIEKRFRMASRQGGEFYKP